jgi:hypothetical protein
MGLAALVVQERLQAACEVRLPQLAVLEEPLLLLPTTG